MVSHLMPDAKQRYSDSSWGLLPSKMLSKYMLFNAVPNSRKETAQEQDYSCLFTDVSAVARIMPGTRVPVNYLLRKLI